MKFIKALMICIIIFLPAAAMSFEKTLAAGVALPVGEFGDAATNGTDIGGCVWFDLLPDMIVGPGVQVGAGLHYIRCGWEDEIIGASGGGHSVAYELLASLRLNLPGGAFLRAGSGITKLGGDAAGIDIDVPDAYTFAVGLGKRFTLIEAEVAYHSVDVDSGSLPLDISWRYVSIGAAVVF